MSHYSELVDTSVKHIHAHVHALLVFKIFTLPFARNDDFCLFRDSSLHESAEEDTETGACGDADTCYAYPIATALREGVQSESLARVGPWQCRLVQAIIQARTSTFPISLSEKKGRPIGIRQ